MAGPTTREPSPPSVLHGGLLSAAVLRDISDLNRKFIGLCLEPALSVDPRFALPDCARVALRDGDAALLDRFACCPFTLFELGVPSLACPRLESDTRIEDARRVPVDAATVARTHDFANVAVFVAWRLADTDPLALRLAMGLAAAAERQLAQMPPSDLPQLANRPQLIRPRWLEQSRYWALLARAAAVPGEAVLRRAHCAGICMIVADLYRGAAPPRRCRST